MSSPHTPTSPLAAPAAVPPSPVEEAPDRVPIPETPEYGDSVLPVSEDEVVALPGELPVEPDPRWRPSADIAVTFAALAAEANRPPQAPTPSRQSVESSVADGITSAPAEPATVQAPSEPGDAQFPAEHAAEAESPATVDEPAGTDSPADAAPPVPPQGPPEGPSLSAQPDEPEGEPVSVRRVATLTVRGATSQGIELRTAEIDFSREMDPNRLQSQWEQINAVTREHFAAVEADEETVSTAREAHAQLAELVAAERPDPERIAAGLDELVTALRVEADPDPIFATRFIAATVEQLTSDGDLVDAAYDLRGELDEAFARLQPRLTELASGAVPADMSERREVREVLEAYQRLHRAANTVHDALPIEVQASGDWRTWSAVAWSALQRTDSALSALEAGDRPFDLTPPLTPDGHSVAVERSSISNVADPRIGLASLVVAHNQTGWISATRFTEIAAPTVTERLAALEAERLAAQEVEPAPELLVTDRDEGVIRLIVPEVTRRETGGLGVGYTRLTLTLPSDHPDATSELLGILEDEQERIRRLRAQEVGSSAASAHVLPNQQPLVNSYDRRLDQLAQAGTLLRQVEQHDATKYIVATESLIRAAQRDAKLLRDSGQIEITPDSAATLWNEVAKGDLTEAELLLSGGILDGEHDALLAVASFHLVKAEYLHAEPEPGAAIPAEVAKGRDMLTTARDHAETVLAMVPTEDREELQRARDKIVQVLSDLGSETTPTAEQLSAAVETLDETRAQSPTPYSDIGTVSYGQLAPTLRQPVIRPAEGPAYQLPSADEFRLPAKPESIRVPVIALEAGQVRKDAVELDLGSERSASSAICQYRRQAASTDNTEGVENEENIEGIEAASSVLERWDTERRAAVTANPRAALTALTEQLHQARRLDSSVTDSARATVECAVAMHAVVDSLNHLINNDLAPAVAGVREESLSAAERNRLIDETLPAMLGCLESLRPAIAGSDLSYAADALEEFYGSLTVLATEPGQEVEELETLADALDILQSGTALDQVARLAVKAVLRSYFPQDPPRPSSPGHPNRGPRTPGPPYGSHPGAPPHDPRTPGPAR